MTTATTAISQTETQLRDILSRRIMILDGAMGTIIQQYKLDEAGLPRRSASPTSPRRPAAARASCSSRATTSC